MKTLKEFGIALRIPRSAITDSILIGVRQLNETKEIEPFLREIISDKTSTPHTSTEIADIMTTHITCAGKPCLAAFVNKGKSYPKVTAKEVAHQIVRLDIPGIGLMILLAVGDIHDDAKRVLIQIAEKAKAEYMIVDAIDVARLFIGYHKICPNDGTPYTNGKCKKCGSPAANKIELTLRTYEDPIYTILSQSESGKGVFKKYSVEILTDSHYSRTTLREVIKKLTRELLHNHAEEQTIQVGRIYSFLYLDLRDRQHTNWICRTLWINPELPESFRPLDLGGNEWLDGIEVDWNPNYSTMHDYFLSNSGSKNECICKINSIFQELEEIVQMGNKHIEEYDNDILQKDLFQKIMEQKEVIARKLLSEMGNQKFPPLECAECDLSLQLMSCRAHDIFLPFANYGKANWNWHQKLWFMRNAQKDYEKDKIRFLYERDKIR